MKKQLLCGLVFWSFIFQLLGQTYVPGQSYFGTNGYIEYLAGNLPIILSAPHGGLLTPSSIPDRDCANCSTVNDFNTQELTRAVANAIYARTGCWPHVVFNKLHRRKLDANREIVEAADGNPAAELAWNEFHIFIETAKNQLLPAFGKGFYIDLHGHAHNIPRLELGYLLSASELALADPELNAPAFVVQSSIRHLAEHNALDLSHAELLHGPSSLGEMLHQMGYPATPSLADPFPDSGEDYFNGGYNTARHTSLTSGSIDGLQIECNRAGIRDSMHNVLRFADSLSVAVLDYLALHYFGQTSEALCPPELQMQEPPVSAQIEVYPNPYCVHFFVTKTAFASPGNWVCEVFDFYGNLLRTNMLEDGVPLEIIPRKKENVFLVLRRDGEVITMRTVLRYCR